MRFNVNHNVRVKLNQRGIAILKEQHEELRSVVSSIGDFVPPAIDHEGWNTFQLWNLMQVFGPHIFMGCIMPFATTIEIIEGQS